MRELLAFLVQLHTQVQLNKYKSRRANLHLPNAIIIPCHYTLSYHLAKAFPRPPTFRPGASRLPNTNSVWQVLVFGQAPGCKYQIPNDKLCQHLFAYLGDP